MPQIAQQDYIVIPIASIGAGLTDDEKKQIINAHKNQTIFDVILRDEQSETDYRILVDAIVGADTIVIVYNGDVTSVDVTL